MRGLRLITVAGGKSFPSNFSQKCISSWGRIDGLVGSPLMINGGLTEYGLEFAAREGFHVPDMHPTAVLDAVANRPGLAYIRRNLYTWRHLIDGLILLRDAEFIIFVDTDVFVTRPVSFDLTNIDCAYNCDDIPGYRGDWLLPLRESLVPSINPGFLVINPRAVDLDALDNVILDYIKDSKACGGTYWWTRQVALAVMVAHIEKRAMFDGRDVRVFSGNQKRTPHEIKTNRWKMIGPNRVLENEDIARDSVDGAAIVHLAGLGKRWLYLLESNSRSGCSLAPTNVRLEDAPAASFMESLLISMRMFLIGSRIGAVARRMRQALMRRQA